MSFKNLTPKLAVLSALASLVTATSAVAALTSNLVAYYPLDETGGLVAADVVGVNNGSLNGNFAGTEWTGGKVGNGLEFTRTARDGSFTTGTHIGWIDADGLFANNVLVDGDPYTFSAWVQWAPAQSGSTNFGYAIWGANTAVGTNSNLLRVGVDDAGDGINAHGTNSLGGVTIPFNDGQFHLVTMAMNAAGNADFYIDGALAISKAADGTAERNGLWSAGNLFSFGMEMEANQATDGFSGIMDELAIWNRELSAAEILELYNNGNGLNLLAVVPEPSRTLLVGVGLLALVIRRRR